MKTKLEALFTSDSGGELKVSNSPYMASKVQISVSAYGTPTVIEIDKEDAFKVGVALIMASGRDFT